MRRLIAVNNSKQIETRNALDRYPAAEKKIRLRLIDRAVRVLYRCNDNRGRIQANLALVMAAGMTMIGIGASLEDSISRIVARHGGNPAAFIKAGDIAVEVGSRIFVTSTGLFLLGFLLPYVLGLYEKVTGMANGDGITGINRYKYRKGLGKR